MALNQFLTVAPTTPSSMKVIINGGWCTFGPSTLYIPTQILSSSIVAPIANPRIDVIGINSSGAVVVLTGTEAINPVPQNISSIVALVQITLQTTTTSINSTMMQDARPILCNSNLPTGAITAYGASTAPGGFLLCDGTSYSQTLYPNLYAIIGTGYGSIGAGFFNVPDYRGRFIRGVDNGAGNDPDTLVRTASNPGGNTGDSVGSYQADAFRTHQHVVNLAVATGGSGAFTGPNGNSGISDPTTTFVGGNETRPVNVYSWFIIKT
jgi:microcystin-dependent protein